MNILENELLARYTTFHMGGIVKKMYIPQNVDELLRLMGSNPQAFDYCIGGGSNLLINDEAVFDEAVNLREFNKRFENLGGGKFYIGASVRLQKAINSINELEYGGIEYLFSVPGLIGGAIYMNAGRGKTYHQCLSDYILEVEALVDGKVVTFKKDDCGFSYRKSIFQELNKCIILGATFAFDNVPKEESQRRKKERIDHCKQCQDNSAYNFGTVFCKANKIVMEFVRLTSRKQKAVSFSAKTRNWLLNDGTGKFSDTIGEMNRVKRLHGYLGLPCQEEVVIWGSGCAPFL